MSFRWGLISQVGDGAQRGRVRVVFQEDGIESAWLPVLSPFTLGARAMRLPRKGSLVAVLLDEHAEDGAVIGAAFNRQDPPPSGGPLVDVVEYDDGTRLEYDPEAHRLKASLRGGFEIQADGEGSLDAGGPVRVKAPAVSIQADVTVEGNLTVTKKLTAKESSATHQHPLDLSRALALPGAP